jgi:hypothetical protein
MSGVRVEHTSREIIERKLLNALANKDCVAVIFNEKDLNQVIAAIQYIELREHMKRSSLLSDLLRLRKEAFGS